MLSADDCAGFCNSDTYLVDGGILGQCAGKMAELVHYIQCLAFADVRLNVQSPWGRLMQSSLC